MKMLKTLMSLTTMILFLSSCGEQTQETEEEHGPGLYFEEDTYDFGEVTLPAFSDTIRFKNKSNETIQINSATTNHGALYGSYNTEPVEPGEHGEVYFRIEDDGILGPFTGEVDFLTDKDESKVITVKAQIVEEKEEEE